MAGCRRREDECESKGGGDDLLLLACPCGSTTGTSTGGPALVFVCHCSMCPEESRREAWCGGTPWAAIRRARWSYKGDGGGGDGLGDGVGGAVEGEGGCASQGLDERRSSPFARRLCCRACGHNLSIAYDCEAHTEWVHCDAMPGGESGVASGGTPVSHLHANGHGPYGDGRPWYDRFGPWVDNPDPCRPPGTPAPAVCVTCWQTQPDACVCADTDAARPGAEGAPAGIAAEAAAAAACAIALPATGESGEACDAARLQPAVGDRG